jgi:hypothetical protein
MFPQGRKLFGSQKNGHPGSGESGTFLAPPGGGRSPPGRSFRERLSSFFHGGSNNSSLIAHATQDSNASTSPVPDFESERIQTIGSPNTPDRPKSSGLPTDIPPPLTPRRSSITITKSIHSHISPAVEDHDESPEIQLAPRSDATDMPPVVEEGPRETSWKDTLRTAYNGFSQVLNIAAESSDAFPPLKSVLGGVRAVLKAAEVSSH